MPRFASKRLPRAAAAGGLLVGSVVLFACQALLDFTPADRPDDGGATDSSSNEDGSVATPSDAGGDVADAAIDVAVPFCSSIPVVPGSTFCADFDGIDHDHGDFVDGKLTPGADAGIELGPNVSPPGAFVVTLPDGEPPTAGAFQAQTQATISLAGVTSLRCELAWRIDERPPPDSGEYVDLITFYALKSAGEVSNAIVLVESAAGTVGLFTGVSTEQLFASDAGFAHALIDIDLAEGGTSPTLTLRYPGAPQHGPRVIYLPDPATVIVQIGAYSTDRGPWRVRFDNVYCKRSP